MESILSVFVAERREVVGDLPKLEVLLGNQLSELKLRVFYRQSNQELEEDGGVEFALFNGHCTEKGCIVLCKFVGTVKSCDYTNSLLC